MLTSNDLMQGNKHCIYKCTDIYTLNLKIKMYQYVSLPPYVQKCMKRMHEWNNVSLPTPYLTWVFSPTPWLRTPPVSLTYLTDLYLSHSGIPVKHPGFNPNIINEPDVEGEIFFWFDVMFFILWYKKIIIICMIIQFPKNIVKL